MNDPESATSKQYEVMLQLFNSSAQSGDAECRINLIKVKTALFLRIEGRAQLPGSGGPGASGAVRSPHLRA